LKSKWADKGVLFGSLDELVQSHGELIRKHLFTRAVDPSYDKFAALHAACWSGGHLLYVPRGIAVNEPLHCLSAITNGDVDLGHTLIILEEGSEATILCETASKAAADGGLHCGATEAILAPSFRLALRSSKGNCWPGCVAAVDNRRDGQPAVEGQPARGTGRTWG